ncbi:MAG: SLBB domain-containing protein [Desulfobacterales bacterium]|nr:SLBB domain-containing protein [Desulfobacterales bacterium]
MKNWWRKDTQKKNEEYQYPRILLKNRKSDRILTLDEYRLDDGYIALAQTLKTLKPNEVTQKIDEAGVRGRGGAGFPLGKKWLSVAADAPFPRYFVVNCDEMEPGTFKDRVLLHTNPHNLIEGMIISGYAVSACKGFIFVRPSYETLSKILEREVEIARRAGYLGENILGSGFSFDIVVHRSGGRYICGEATALLNAIQGKRPNPKQPPPYPTSKGMWDKPTVTNNVETVVWVPHILRHGSQWYKSLAAGRAGDGTKLYCVSGKVKNPGCFELPMGTRLSEIVDIHAGGMQEGCEFKACLPGGASTRFMTSKYYHIEMDFDSVKKAGHRLGTGAVIVFDQNTCLVDATLNLMEFFARESCGWCTPCREGIPYICDILRRIENGEGKAEFVGMLRDMSKHLWNSYCAFAPGAVSSLESLITYFEDEIFEHIWEKKCPFKDNSFKF